MIYYNVQTNSTENTSVVSISNRVNTFLQFLHAMEYLVLTISFSRLIWRVNPPCKNYCSSLLQNICRNNRGKIQYKHVLLFGIFFVIYTVLAFWPPTMYTLYYSSREVETITYNLMIFIAHFSNWIIRVALMLTTLKVIDEWQSAFEDKQPRSDSVRCLTECYTNVGMKISSYKEGLSHGLCCSGSRTSHQ